MGGEGRAGNCLAGGKGTIEGCSGGHVITETRGTRRGQESRLTRRPGRPAGGAPGPWGVPVRERTHTWPSRGEAEAPRGQVPCRAPSLSSLSPSCHSGKETRLEPTFGGSVDKAVPLTSGLRFVRIKFTGLRTHARRRHRGSTKPPNLRAPALIGQKQGAPPSPSCSPVSCCSDGPPPRRNSLGPHTEGASPKLRATRAPRTCRPAAWTPAQPGPGAETACGTLPGRHVALQALPDRPGPGAPCLSSRGHTLTFLLWLFVMPRVPGAPLFIHVGTSASPSGLPAPGSQGPCPRPPLPQEVGT